MAPSDRSEREDPTLADRAERDPDAVDLDAVARRADGDEADRQLAAEALRVLAVRAPDRLDEAAPILEGLLRDEEPAIRSEATIAAERLTQTRLEAVEPLAAALVERLDDRASTRHTALTALSAVAPTAPEAMVSAVPEIGADLESDVPDVRAKAVTVVANAVAADPEAAVPLVPSLLDVLESRDEADSGAGRRVDSDDVRSEVVEGENTVRQQTEEARAQAARALVTVGRARPDAVADSVPRLHSLLDAEATVPAQVALVDVLASVAGEQPDGVRPIVGTLGRLLADGENAELRGTAARALGNAGTEYPNEVESVVRPRRQEVVELLGADSAHVRASAATLISVVGDVDPGAYESAGEPLVDCLDDEAATVRGSAALALGSIGVDQASDELRRTADGDPDENVRDAAASAIDAIEAGQH